MESTDNKQSTWLKSMELEQIGNFVMKLTCVMTPLSIFYHNPRYLYSSEGFADGGDLYSHFTEANHIKETMKNFDTNFWFRQAALGYPMFTAYQPLPGFFIAICMLLFERILSPLLIFRLIFVTVLTFIPVAIHKSAQIFGLKPVEQIILCLLSFAIQSWRKFGLEIPAFVDYGLLTQAFGMLILFPAVSILYRWIMINGCKQEDSTLPILILSLSFLTNFFFGILTCILAGTMIIVNLATSRHEPTEHLLQKLQNFLRMVATSVMLISWWVLACYMGYSYIGGLPWRGESEDGYKLSFITERFSEGEIFDSHRFFPWFTLLVLLGITINCLNTVPNVLQHFSCTDAERTRSYWLLLSTVVSFMLFLGRNTFSFFYDFIPLHTELETVKYLSALHFCGLIYASHALSELIHRLSEYLCSIIQSIDESIENDSVSIYSEFLKAIQMKLQSFGGNYSTLVKHKDNTMKIILLLIVTCCLWNSHFQTVGKHLTMTEVNYDFIKQLKTLRNNTVDGRLLGHRGFGTASSFDLAFLPHYTGKPGLVTYSRGYHDSLSVFYLESLRFNPDKIPFFVNTLRLYNVHYLVTADVKLDESFSKACQLKYLKKIADLIFYEVLHQDNDYGYFDFVRIPGYIKGDLKLIRQAVLNALELYRVNSLLLINPTEDTGFNKNVVVDVKKIPLWKNWGNFVQKKVQVTWSLKGVEADSEVILDKLIKADSWKWIYSQVIEERVVDNDYQAIVHVSDRGSDVSLAEHLLLKVTYHPFWKCFYYHVSDDFVLDMFKDSQFFDGKMYAHVNHVIPNLMSVSLPPGRYLVIVTYRFPGIFKILSMFCAFISIRMLLRHLSEYKKQNLSTKPRNELSKRSGKLSGKEPDIEKSDPLKDQVETVAASSRDDEDTLPNYRHRRATTQTDNMPDYQVFVRATLQKRRMIQSSGRVSARKEKEPVSDGRNDPIAFEYKLMNNETEKQNRDNATPKTSKRAASMPNRKYNDQAIEDCRLARIGVAKKIAGAQIGAEDNSKKDYSSQSSNSEAKNYSSQSSNSDAKNYSSQSTNSETSGSEDDRASDRSSTRLQIANKNSTLLDEIIIDDHFKLQGSEPNEKSTVCRLNRDYQLDVNANITRKRTPSNSSGHSGDSVASASRDPRVSDSSSGEESYLKLKGRNLRFRGLMTKDSADGNMDRIFRGKP